MKLEDHPAVSRFRSAAAPTPPPTQLEASWLRARCLELGADDVGFVSIDRPELDDQRDDILSALPTTRTLVSFVVKLNQEPIRTPARSISNLEFHHVGERVNEVARELVRDLQERGVQALNPAMGFPMEASGFPGKIWTVGHKPVAVAAGLGQMGIHRNVIHPKFGNFILLGTVLIGVPISDESQPIDYNPCLECKLCVAACPVGAISSDGHFDFSACYTHNYREFMGGFTDWVGTIADSKDARDYRSRMTEGESTSMWQSLSFGANYKAAYCLAVCPAGDDVMGPFLDRRPQHVQDVVKPLQSKEEPVYVVPGSDAAEYVASRYPHKTVRTVEGSLRPATIRNFLLGMPLTFQRGQSAGIDMTIDFTFTGAKSGVGSVTIRDQKLTVLDHHAGRADLHVTAEGQAWLDFLAGNRGLVGALLTGKIRLAGSPKHLQAFGRCFPR